MGEVEYEAEVRIRRNGRLVRITRALGDDAQFALQSAMNDLERELQDNPWPTKANRIDR